MADRIFKGRLICTDEIFEENISFPEASESFDTPHRGGLVPFEIFRDIIHNADGFATDIVKGDLLISSIDGSWVKVTRDGTIEVGCSGA